MAGVWKIIKHLVAVSLFTNTCIFGEIVQRVRLVNGSHPQEGRLEVMVDDKWGTVCDDNFDNAAAVVVCRMLRYPSSDVIAYHEAHFGQGTGQIHLDKVQCNGTETDLNDCRFSILTACSHVGVSCAPTPIPATRITFTEKPRTSSSWVPIAGIWGMVVPASLLVLVWIIAIVVRWIASRAPDPYLGRIISANQHANNAIHAATPSSTLGISPANEPDEPGLTETPQSNDIQEPPVANISGNTHMLPPIKQHGVVTVRL